MNWLNSLIFWFLLTDPYNEDVEAEVYETEVTLNPNEYIESIEIVER